jgi:cbb3-type cytochrome oxidase subunit 3
MSKIVSRLLENVTWLDELSSITTIFFFLLFIALIVGVLRMKKSTVDEIKNLPLDNDNSNEV